MSQTHSLSLSHTHTLMPCFTSSCLMKHSLVNTTAAALVSLSLIIMKLRTTFIVVVVISLLFDERITTTTTAPFNASLATYLPPPGDSNHNVLESPNQMFTLTVKPWRDSSSYHYCMAAVMNSKIDPSSMVWSTSYDSLPINTASCPRYFSSQGDLLFQDNDRNITVWQTHTSGMGVTALTLQDSGNMVFTDAHPIFQLYAGQNFTTNMTLWSSSQFSSNCANFSVPGSFGLRYDNIYHRLLLFIREKWICVLVHHISYV